ncbi:MAG: NAD(P)H-hydrate dehydratase, partial [Terriglobales bacterium]
PRVLRGEAAEAWAALRQSAPDRAHVAADADAWSRWRQRLPQAAVVLDAILGTGLEAPPRDFAAAVIRDANELAPAAARVAVDLPSGLPADGEFAAQWAAWDWSAVFQAAATVTFTAPKIGQVSGRGAAFCGRLYVMPIGTPAALLASGEFPIELATAAALRRFAAPRPADSHKGRYGHVLVVGGSLGKSGAAAMAAEAALRAGAGLVTAAVPRSVQPLVAAYRPEVMTEALAETSEGTLAAALVEPECLRVLCAGKTVLALGPGVSAQAETAATVRRLIAAAPLPWVLDADGLNAFDGHRDELRAGAAGGVLTPHPGEMARLLGVSIAAVQARRVQLAQELARETGAVVALKGFRTVVAGPSGRVWINPTGNPGMASGGSGDVLTGIVAGLLAQFPAAPRGEVVAAAVYLHGWAADLAVETTGEMGLCATDITAHLPAALRRLGAAPPESAELVLDLKGPERDLPADR